MKRRFLENEGRNLSCTSRLSPAFHHLLCCRLPPASRLAPSPVSLFYSRWNEPKPFPDWAGPIKSLNHAPTLGSKTRKQLGGATVRAETGDTQQDAWCRLGAGFRVPGPRGWVTDGNEAVRSGNQDWALHPTAHMGVKPQGGGFTWEPWR